MTDEDLSTAIAWILIAAGICGVAIILVCGYFHENKYQRYHRRKPRS